MPDRPDSPSIATDAERSPPRILYVAQANFLASARSGGGQRTLAILDALAAEGPVDVIAFSRPGPSPLSAEAEQALPARTVTRVTLPAATRLERLRDRGRLIALGRTGAVPDELPLRRAMLDLHAERRFALVAFRYAISLSYAGFLPGVPTFVDNDDSIPERIRTAALQRRGPARWMQLARAGITAGIYRRMLARATCVVAVKPEDLHLAPAPIAETLPNVAFVVTPDVVPPERAATPTAVFIGTLDYAPNIEAVEFLVGSAWPAVRRSVPDAELRIVGTKASPERAKRWGTVPGVRFVGEVPSIAAAYAGSWIALNPIESGSGSNIKVAEAMLLGRPVVSSAFGVRGWEAAVGDEHGLLAAEDQEGFVAECVRLLASAERCARIGAAARTWADANASPAAFAAIARRLIRATMAAGRGR